MERRLRGRASGGECHPIKSSSCGTGSVVSLMGENPMALLISPKEEGISTSNLYFPR